MMLEIIVMSYVDVHDTKNDVVNVVERVDGKRIFTELNIIIFIMQIHGKKRSIYDEPTRRSVAARL